MVDLFVKKITTLEVPTPLLPGHLFRSSFYIIIGTTIYIAMYTTLTITFVRKYHECVGTILAMSARGLRMYRSFPWPLPRTAVQRISSKVHFNKTTKRQ